MNSISVFAAIVGVLVYIAIPALVIYGFITFLDTLRSGVHELRSLKVELRNLRASVDEQGRLLRAGGRDDRELPSGPEGGGPPPSVSPGDGS